MDKRILGVVVGAIAGVIDVIPMMLQKLTWDANLSAFSMWVVVGFFIASTELKLHPILKGLVISYLVLLPSAFIIAWEEPITLLPILIMTTMLGGILGLSIEKLSKRDKPNL